MAHVTAVAFVAKAVFQPPPEPIPVRYEVQLLNVPTPEPEVESVKKPPPEPEPEPVKKPPPPPEPKVVAKKVEKKPPPPPPPEPKVVAKKVEKKPEPPPPTPEPEVEEKIVPVEKPPPQPEVVAKSPPPPKVGVQREQLPPILNAWGRAVQRKVEKYWLVPGGIALSEANREVHISFWVDRDGKILGRPEIIKDAQDPALGESGIRAILMAEPLPPLPMEYKEREQQVVYVFSLRK